MSRRQRQEFLAHLFGCLSDQRNLRCALDHIGREDKAPGPNGLRPEELNNHERWALVQAFSESIRSGQYRLGPVRHRQIPKASGNGTRPIDIFNVQDKVVQRAVLQVLQPLLDPHFDERSFGFRPGLGREHALIAAERLARQTRRWVWITEDFRNAFTQVPRSRLFDVLRLRGLDDSMLSLIGVIVGEANGKGLSQGSCLSPFLLNLYCDHFLDRPWRQRHPNAAMIRVADDLLVLAADHAEAERLYAALRELATAIGMSLKHGPGNAIRQLDRGEHAEWLGYRIAGDQASGLRAQIASRSWNRLAEKLAMAHSEPQACFRAAETVRGWAEQLGACYGHENHRAVYERVAALAHAHAFEEIPSFQSFSSAWEHASLRYHHLQQAVLLQDAQCPEEP
jgi:hypothetical protein